ncbi:MAG: purine/pyrimidine permease [Bacillota bacterium]|nr:purine/pyrimidine permease [Bacillota bacterium]
MHKSYLYYLDEKPKNRYQFTLYVIQWLAYSSGAIITVPLILGLPFGLDQLEIAALMQRIFFYTGIATLLQIHMGHGIPMVEGPSSLWWAVMANLAVSARSMGMEASLLRSHMEFSMIAGGIITVIIAKLRIFEKAEGYFTPMLTGTTLVLLPLQASKMFITGMLGITEKGPDIFTSVTSFIVIILVILISIKTKGFVQSISVLIGIFAGWLIHALFGKVNAGGLPVGPLVSFPKVFAWGIPTFGAGVFVTQTVISFISVVLAIASIKVTMQDLNFESSESINKGILVSGISNVLAGIGGSVGTTPFATSTGLIKISRVASIYPFRVHAVVLVALGFVPVISIAISTIPSSVAYSVFVVSMGTLLCLGLQEYKKLEFRIEEMLVVGISLIVGVGIISLPSYAFTNLPDWAAYTVSNGMVTGVAVCFILENALKVLVKRDRTA